jgi:hypothetical protein
LRRSVAPPVEFIHRFNPDTVQNPHEVGEEGFDDPEFDFME